jgi:hypothetical protein
MLEKGVVVQFEVIFQNFQGRVEKIHEKSQINVASLGVEILRRKPRNAEKTTFELLGHVFTCG